MAYEVTAARRRPQRFEDLAGQDFVAATLQNAIQAGQIAHAYLFSGPRGCGKTSAARILAKALNCEKGPAATPCGTCTSCTEITKGSSLDVIEIDGASNTSVNDVRQIKDEVLFPPNTLRYKIYIIDEVHMLSTSAFNALLKTIEEPPPYVIFIFATTELQKVPATIKSRCQQFHFRLAASGQVKELLTEAAGEAGIQTDDEALCWIARESGGSIRDAYTLFDQVAAFSGGHITYDKIRDKLGLVGAEQLNGLCEKCAAGDPAGAMQVLDGIFQGGVSVEQFIANMADYLRSLLFIQSGVTKEALLGQAPGRFSQAVLGVWKTPALERALSLFLALYRDVRYSLNQRYEVDLAISRLCWLASWVSPPEVKAAIDDARRLLGGAAQRPLDSGGTDRLESPRPVSPPTFTPPPESAEDAPVRANPGLSLQELRKRALEELAKKQGMAASALSQTVNWTFEDSVVRAQAESEFVIRQVAKDKAGIAETLSALWGKPVSFEVGLKTGVPGGIPEDGTKMEDISPQAELVRRVFRGIIMEANK
jgi:DNA polymerase-3 subunit gamma/tau